MPDVLWPVESCTHTVLSHTRKEECRAAICASCGQYHIVSYKFNSYESEQGIHITAVSYGIRSQLLLFTTMIIITGYCARVLIYLFYC